MTVPQLDYYEVSVRDIALKDGTKWPFLHRALAMSSSIFSGLDFHGYIIKDKPNFSVNLQNGGTHRIIKLAFTDSDLSEAQQNAYVLDVLRDSLAYAYLSIIDSYQAKIGFMNVMYGEVYNDSGDIEPVGLVVHLVTTTTETGVTDTSTDINQITAVLLANIEYIFQQLKEKDAQDTKSKKK